MAQISFFVDPDHRSPSQILCDWWPLVLGADVVARAGARVTVVQACGESGRVQRNGVDYEFVAADPGAPRMVHSRAFAALIESLQADVFHVHGLGFADDVLALNRLAPRTPILLQDHADRVPRLWRRRRLRRAMSLAGGLALCATAQALPFRRAGLLGARTRVFEIAEVSSGFTPGDRGEARLDLGMTGAPAVLWVGNLDDNKDPLTVLRGIGAAARRLPGLELWCCFARHPLLDKVRDVIARDPCLEGRVHLVGRVSHAQIERYMQAADLFVLGSHREGSGVAVIEALACGLTPVVTDIPSFRMLTADGGVGALWPCGNSDGLCAAIVAAAARPAAAARAAVRAHFERHLSTIAVGTQWLGAYRRVIDG